MAEPTRRKRKATAKELAKKWGVCERTIRNYVAQPRTEWLKQNNTEKAKPWEALGISRATWFRRGKPEQWQRYARFGGVGGVASDLTQPTSWAALCFAKGSEFSLSLTKTERGCYSGE